MNNVERVDQHVLENFSFLQAAVCHWQQERSELNDLQPSLPLQMNEKWASQRQWTEQRLLHRWFEEEHVHQVLSE